MDAAFAWLGQLMEWFGQFVPRWVIIDTTQAGVKFVRGATVKTIGPGMHFYWPLTTLVRLYPTARQADDLRTQTIVTADDKVLVVGGMIVYEVHDVERILAHTYEPQQTIKDISLTAIHDVVCQMKWDELKAAQRSGVLDRRLKSEVHAALKSYGITTLKVQLTDLAPARVLKLMQSTSVDGV